MTIMNRSYSGINFSHVHKNINGEYLLSDALNAIIKQADFLTQYIDDVLKARQLVNSDWISESSLRTLIIKLNEAHKKSINQIDKNKQRQVSEKLLLEQQKIYVWRNDKCMGKSFDTGLTCSTSYRNRMEVSDLLQYLTEQIDTYGLTIKELDYRQYCRYQIMQSFKDGTVTVANKIGIVK